jgi:spermidine synthase
MSLPMCSIDLIQAGKAPRHLFPWPGFPVNAKLIEGHAFLFDVCMAGLHLVDDNGFGGYTIMDDSDAELSRHLNAVRHAHGRVLKTGLGMGCFVRMCLQKPDVEHIDVVELNADIIEHFGAEFSGDPRVTIHHQDAFEFSLSHGPWDFAWHDIYCEGNDGLQPLHVKLINRYRKAAKLQGAWNLPRWVRRLAPRII